MPERVVKVELRELDAEAVLAAVKGNARLEAIMKEAMQPKAWIIRIDGKTVNLFDLPPRILDEVERECFPWVPGVSYWADIIYRPLSNLRAAETLLHKVAEHVGTSLPGEPLTVRTLVDWYVQVDDDLYEEVDEPKAEDDVEVDTDEASEPDPTGAGS